MAENKTDLSTFWDRLADDWETQVGNEGDGNRRLNSDPVIWTMAGNIRGLKVLDAGCGTGYLSRKLREKGAVVTGVDFSPRMIEIARRKMQGIDFHVDSCSKLETLETGVFDRIIANYVLMDLEDLEGTMKAFHRVLKADGFAVLVFSHPCFPQSRATAGDDNDLVSYDWRFNYFKESRHIDPAWGHFTADFIWFHRPLSDYWKAFKNAGFEVTDFEEPRIADDKHHLATNKRQLKNSQSRPYSVAFKIKKQPEVK